MSYWGKTPHFYGQLSCVLDQHQPLCSFTLEETEKMCRGLGRIRAGAARALDILLDRSPTSPPAIASPPPPSLLVSSTTISGAKRKRSLPSSDPTPPPEPVPFEVSLPKRARTDASQQTSPRSTPPGEGECYFCLEPYLDPVTEHCGHTTCKLCWDALKADNKACGCCRRPLAATRPAPR